MIFDPNCQIGYILWFVGIFSENAFCIVSSLLNNILYLWPRHMNIHIQKIKLALTKHAGSPLLGPQASIFMLIFPNILHQILTCCTKFGNLAPSPDVGPTPEFGTSSEILHRAPTWTETPKYCPNPTFWRKPEWSSCDFIGFSYDLIWFSCDFIWF